MSGVQLVMSADEATSAISGRERAFWLQRRQALLIELAAIEMILDLERSVVPKRQRDARRGKAADKQDPQTTS
jgi:hypothetical protein